MMYINLDNIRYKDGITNDPYQQILDWGYKPEMKFDLQIITFNDWLNGLHLLSDEAFDKGNYFFVEEYFEGDTICLRGQYLPIDTFNEIDKFRKEIVTRLLNERYEQFLSDFEGKLEQSYSPDEFVKKYKYEVEFQFIKYETASPLNYYSRFIVDGKKLETLVTCENYNLQINTNDPLGYFDNSQPSQYSLRNAIEIITIFKAKQYLSDWLNMNVGVKATDENVNKNPEFTTARQVLAMHYIFYMLQVKDVDNTVKARFVEFLTGKNEKNIYDAIRNPFQTKENSFRSRDLQFIRPFFENLGLDEIVKMINNQLDSVNGKNL